MFSDKTIHVTACHAGPVTDRRRGKMTPIRSAAVFALIGVLFGGSFLQRRTESALQKGDPMNVSRITVEHVLVVALTNVATGQYQFSLCFLLL